MIVSSPPRAVRSRRDPAEVLDVHDARAGRQGMGKAVNTGVRWMGTSQVAMQVIRVVTTLILARLLEPEDFGIVALVTVLTGFFDRVLGDTGTTTAIVRHPELRQGLASSVLY
jgi:O-antigen/teichoic acid export membrane protein